MGEITKASIIIAAAILLHGYLTGGNIAYTGGFTAVKLSPLGTVSWCSIGEGCK
jgi:hypothetical protein